MFKTAAVIPTGDELKEGIILDTDSPMIIGTLLKINGGAQIIRMAPVVDVQNLIMKTITEAAKTHDLVVLIGGSGGGHRYSATLGKDFTHSSLEEMLTDKYSQQMFGKNGHLWCKLVIGKMDECLVLNVPGPYDEAKAAIEAFQKAYETDEGDLARINKMMMEGVKAKYGF